MASPGRQQISLDGIRSDGWFEQLATEVPEFEQLCQIVGRRFVAFSFVASVRISTISYDSSQPEGSLIDFSLGGDEELQRLTLSEFRERLGMALLSDGANPIELSDAPDDEEVRDHIGRRYLLLAPIFGIRLEHLEHGGGVPPSVTLSLGQNREEVSIPALREILGSAVRSEVERSRPTAPFSIDFKKVPQAEQANQRGDFDETVSLLGAWPGPLSMFLRTPQGQALGPAERGKLVRALGALGDAYLNKGQVDWAEDVVRLGIQFGQELPEAGALFGLLGRTRVASERHGEAIGLLRRALSLGAEPASVLPELARCFVERGRCVAALGCLAEAKEAGVEASQLEELEARIVEALGEPASKYLRWRSEQGPERA